MSVFKVMFLKCGCQVQGITIAISTPNNTRNLSADSWLKQHQRLPLQCQTQGLPETPWETHVCIVMHMWILVCCPASAHPNTTLRDNAWTTKTSSKSKSRQGLSFFEVKAVETLESPWNSMKALENHMKAREKPWNTVISSKQNPRRMLLFPEKTVCGMCSEGAQAFGNRPTYAKPHWVANWPTMVRMRKIGLLNEQQPPTY